MCPAGDEDENSNHNVNPSKLIDQNLDHMDYTTDTQPVNSPLSPFSSPDKYGNKLMGEDGNKLRYLQDTEPVDDNFPFGEAFETQLVDHVGETEVLNLYDETQVVDDGDAFENFCTQLVDEDDTQVAADSDHEGTDKTEVLSDTEVLCDDDNSARRGGCQLADQEINSPQTRDVGGFKAQLDALINDELSSGYLHKGFTSIRAASVRASGLAARRSCSAKRDTALGQHAAEQYGTFISRDSSEFGAGTCQGDGREENHKQMEEFTNEIRSKVSSSTVRKLFAEDADYETEEPKDGRDHIENNADDPQFASDQGLAGLSYIDSQEPGDLSQANALDVVDKFLKLNATECDLDCDFPKSTGGKSKPISLTKGAQSLAKRVSYRSTDAEGGIYDWDDTREDEGGGEFLQKKKELFFYHEGQRRKSLPQPKKGKAHGSNSSLPVEGRRGKDGQMDNIKNFKDSVRSDSRLILRNMGSSAKPFQLRGVPMKNLLSDLDEQVNPASGDGMLCNDSDKNEADMMLDVGLDTQVAAEAMEALCNGVLTSDNECYGSKEAASIPAEGCTESRNTNRADAVKIFPKRTRSSNVGILTRQMEQTRRTSSRSRKEKTKNAGKQFDADQVKSKANSVYATNGSARIESGELSNVSLKKRKERRPQNTDSTDEGDEAGTKSVDMTSCKRHRLDCPTNAFTPIAHRTRRCKEFSESINAGKCSKSLNGKLNNLISSHASSKRRKADAGPSKTMPAKGSEMGTGRKSENAKSVQHEQSGLKHSVASMPLGIDAVDYPRGKRSRHKSPFVGQDAATQHNSRLTRSKARSGGFLLSSLDWKSGERMLQQNMDSSKNSFVDVNAEAKMKDKVKYKASKLSNRNDDKDAPNSDGDAETNVRPEASPRVRGDPLLCASTTPVNCKTPINDASPICAGDEYQKQSCRKNLSKSSLMKEIDSLFATREDFCSPVKDLRKRREMANVRVLFSHHLDADIIKQQKKVMVRLGASVASSMSDATHFVADRFVRTRNMLEAIALGKPVVTHLWLDSCAQANCVIDEKNYILRDARKEKEIRFSMPVSLTRACQHPLLQGQRVLITPNTKPGSEILSSLVKAVRGLAVERLGRSALKNELFPDDLLILSCEEDYEICIPYLEKGAVVYSSELLLNGIVIQKLEFERHRLFADHVKRTRSTIWLKKDSTYHPVNKSK